MTNSVPPRANLAGNAEDKTRKQLIAIIVLLVLIIAMVGTFFFVKVSRDRATVAEGQKTSSASGSGSSGGAAGSGTDAAGNAGAAVEVYKKILVAPPALDTEAGSVSPGSETKYALVHLDAGCVPELVVNYGPHIEGSEINAIGVFGVDENGEQVSFAKSYLDGVASAGGARRSVQRAVNQPGMYDFQGGAMRGSIGALVKRQGGELFDEPANPEPGEFTPFEWIPTQQLDVVEAIAGGTDCAPGAAAEKTASGNSVEAAGGQGPKPTAGANVPVPAPSDYASRSGSGSSGAEDESSGDGSKKTTFTGTVRIFQTDDDLVAYQGIRNPNPGSNTGPYVMLILDSPMQVTAEKSGKQGHFITRSANMLLLDSGADATGTDGERKTVTYSADELYWQSDTSLPMAEPRVKTW